MSWTRTRLAALAAPGGLCLIVLFTPLVDSILGDDDAGFLLPVSFLRWPPAFALAVLAVFGGRMAQGAPTRMRRLATAVTIIDYGSLVIAVVLGAGALLLARLA